MMEYMTCPMCGASLIFTDGVYQCVNDFDCAFEETKPEHESRIKKEGGAKR